MKATHTHRDSGGRFAEIHRAQGSQRLAEAGTIVVYLDIGLQVQSATTLEDWETHWQPITPDTCTVCMGTGRDTIKGNKRNPCGGCYGLGKVRQDGETPKGEWELAEVAGKIIEELRCKLARAEQWLGYPPVAEAIEAHRQAARQAGGDAQAEQERKWREGGGHGPGGARMTGD